MSSTGRGGALVVMGLEGPAAGGTILQRPLSEIWQMVTDIVARPDTPDVTPQTTPRLGGSSGGQTRHAPPLLAGFHSSDARKSKKSLLLRWQDSAGDGAPCRCYEYRYESGGSFETLRRLVYGGASVDASGLSFSVQRDDVAGGRERTVSGAMRQRLSSLSAGSLALPDGRFLLLLLTCFKCYNMSPRFLTTRRTCAGLFAKPRTSSRVRADTLVQELPDHFLLSDAQARTTPLASYNTGYLQVAGERIAIVREYFAAPRKELFLKFPSRRRNAVRAEQCVV